MRIRNYINNAVIALLAISFVGCEKDREDKRLNNIEITVRQKEVSFNKAIINVRHNGPEDITWYGFLTEDVTTPEFRQINNIRKELLKVKEIDLIRENDRNILLEDLQEGTAYKYIAFGLTPDGKLYDNVGFGSAKFETTTNIYALTRTEDWTITRLGRTDDKSKELIEVKANKGGRFAWQYVNKETIDNFDKEYPDGFELWGYENGDYNNEVYFGTVSGIEYFAITQIETVLYYVSQGYKLNDLTYIYEEGKPFEIDRLSSGTYYMVAYGFGGDGMHTQKYSVEEITIDEETAEAGYEKWFGTYEFSGEVEVTQDNGDIVKENRTYNIKIEHYDNNFMYRIHGWECGEDVKYDWEEDIMQLDKSKGEFLAFPAYYSNGNLEMRESPMTYITFDGANTLLLGMYGYSYMKEAKQEVPVLSSGTTMGIAEPIADGSETTVLKGNKTSIEYDGKSYTIDYSKMGYIAWSETTGAWQTINPPMRFPISVKKVESSADADKLSIPASATRLEFSDHKMNSDVIKGDFKRLERVKPEIFKQVIY